MDLILYIQQYIQHIVGEQIKYILLELIVAVYINLYLLMDKTEVDYVHI